MDVIIILFVVCLFYLLFPSVQFRCYLSSSFEKLLRNCFICGYILSLIWGGEREIQAVGEIHPVVSATRISLCSADVLHP